ncbi:MAG: glycosyltransferase family 2 protein [Pseudomonadota bacterium]
MSAFLSIVIPAHEEAEGLARAVAEIQNTAEDHVSHLEIVIVDDGSRDGTWEVIETLSSESSVIRGVRLSRNFGKEAAILAGLSAVRGDVVITIDGDLQHPPAFIPQMLEHWRSGAKVVNMVKATREDEGFLKARLTRIYFSLFTRLAGIEIGNSADFKLLDREVVDCLLMLPERERFYRGLVAWVGFEQKTILFQVAPRLAGQGKWSMLRLARLALDSIVSFSTTPMHMMTFLGGLFGLLAIGLGTRTLWLWLDGRAVDGLTTVILLLIIVGSVLMIGLGIIGVYIAKIYEEVKRRPPFIVQAETLQDARSRQSDTAQSSQPDMALRRAS